ncbi:MAG TPA: amidohydrolase family protein [Gemmatimonadaceae bacterium]|nr:amidohydrolase family protein [Gemmatimonadaceae bacterium]
MYDPSGRGRVRSRRVTVLLGLVPGLVVAMPTPAQSVPIAITAQRIIDGTGVLIPNASVIVEDGRIVSVGARPRGFRGVIYNLGDATVMPGLIDVHAHADWHFNAQGRLHTPDDGETPVQSALAAAANAYEMLMAGITTIQSPGSAADKDLRDAIARGGVPGPRILTSLGSLSERSGDTAQIRRRVRAFKADGADLIKIFASGSIRDGGAPTMTQLQLDAACGEARAVGLRAIVHAHAEEAMRRAVDAGCNQIEHGLFATPEILALMAQRGTYFSPQCGLIFRNYLENRARYEGIGNYNAEGFAAMERSLPQSIETIRRAVATRGLKVVFGSDAVAGAHGRNVEDLICRVREAGQSRMDAITMATSRSAESLQLADSIGKLHRGMVADIIAVAGNPLDNFLMMRRVIFVMKGGRVYRNDGRRLMQAVEGQ